MSKQNKNGNKAKIVKVEGAFTEWYAPGYANPYNDTDGFAEFQEEAGMPFVYGPVVTDANIGDNICDDLQCLCEREVVDEEGDWDENTDKLVEAAETALETGEVQKVKIGETEFTCTPYAEVPAIPDSSYEAFGEFADVVRERVAAI